MSFFNVVHIQYANKRDQQTTSLSVLIIYTQHTKFLCLWQIQNMRLDSPMEIPSKHNKPEPIKKKHIHRCFRNNNNNMCSNNNFLSFPVTYNKMIRTTNTRFPGLLFCHLHTHQPFNILLFYLYTSTFICISHSFYFYLKINPDYISLFNVIYYTSNQIIMIMQRYLNKHTV